jgi:hypothetical protein
MLKTLTRLFTHKPEPKTLICRRSSSLKNYVVGEVSCQKALSRLAAPKTEDGHHSECQVTFEHEPTNRLDRKAVKATASGQPIGYLPRHLADDFHAAMRANGTVRAVADGEICGGRLHLGTGGKQNFRVKVFMKWPPEGEVR